MRKLLLLSVLFLLILPSSLHAQARFAGTSFEESPYRTGTYTDTGDPSMNHPLENNEGEPLVNFTSSPEEIGFSSYYYDTRNSIGLTDGDYVGVTNSTFGFEGYPDGDQGFQMSDTDGRMTLTLEAVDLTAASDPHVSLRYFVRETSYEGNDTLRITVVADGGEELLLLEASGPDLEALATGQFEFVQHDLSGYSTAEVQLSFDANADAERVAFDDVQFTEGPRTSVQFSAEGESVPEGDAAEDTYALPVTIANPSAETATTAEVVATGGSATEGEDYRYDPQTVTFPAGSAAPQTVTVTILEDTEYELDETIEFLLQEVEGGNSAAASAPNTFTLTLQNDDTQNSTLAINEILADPPTSTTCESYDRPPDCGDANNDGTRSPDDDEFVEIINTGSEPVDLSGHTLSDEADIRYTFPKGTTLEPGTAATIFGGGAPQGIPGFVATTATLDLNNAGDVVTLYDESGAILASHGYGNEASNGQSIARNPDGTGAFEQHRTIDRDGNDQADDDLFSPGYENAGLARLPVELISFEAVINQADVLLRWSTASEKDNAGFEVQRKLDGTFQKIDFVEGHGSTTQPRSYRYRVENVSPGAHVFRLRQVDFDGTYSYSGERTVEVAVSGGYALSLAHPNPFRSRTAFAVSVAEGQDVTINVYNVLGQRVQRLFDGRLEARSEHVFTIDANELPSGVYFYRVTGESFARTESVILIR